MLFLLGLLPLAHGLLSEDDLSEHFDFLFMVYGLSTDFLITILQV